MRKKSAADDVNRPVTKFIKTRKSIPLWIILILALTTLSSCGEGASPGSTSSPVSETAIVLPTETATLEPSPTMSVPVTILHAPAGADTSQVDLAQRVLSGLSVQEGGQFEMREALTDADFALKPWLVVNIAPDPGVASLAAAHPDIQFLAIGIPGLEPAQNLNIINSINSGADQQGFLAGYLAAVLTPDWRAGVISPTDTVEGKSARNSFLNGVIFYCGLCRPVYPPYFAYPIYYDVASNSTQEEKIAAADYLISQGVKTVYLAPGADDPFLMEYLANAGVNMIGTVTPPENVKGQWLASIQTDLETTIAEIWGRLKNGEGGIVLNQPIALNNQNEALFSIGRQQFVNKLLEDLLSGFIDTGIDPITGESSN